jgi:O-antigen/teichoic acid export membrane protein
LGTSGIFTVLLPGLLFFSVVTAQEPLYEAQGRVKSLQKLILIVSFINLVLNFYLVPFAGFFGAATATTISMLFYFCLFGRHLDKIFRIEKILYLLAGAEIYLVYMIFHKLNFGFLITFWLMPIVLFILFSLVNLFYFKKGYSVV